MNKVSSMVVRVSLLLVFLSSASCGSFGVHSSQEQRSEGGDGSVISHVGKQSQTTSSNSSLKDSQVESMTVSNKTGMESYWFIIGSLLIGIIVPRPKFVRKFFED